MSDQSTPEVKCPKCGSNQVYAGKKGFSGKKAVAGAVLTGGIGLLAGTIGSNKIKITCLNCGNVFKPGDTAKAQQISSTTSTVANNQENANGCLMFVLIAVVAVIIYFSCNG